MKIYHYTSMANFALIWQSQRLKFSESKGTNDFFERHKIIEADGGTFTYNGEKTELEVIQHNIDAIFYKINKFKQISLCIDSSEAKMKMEFGKMVFVLNLMKVNSI